MLSGTSRRRTDTGVFAIDTGCTHHQSYAQHVNCDLRQLAVEPRARRCDGRCQHYHPGMKICGVRTVAKQCCDAHGRLLHHRQRQLVDISQSSLGLFGDAQRPEIDGSALLLDLPT